MDDVTAEKVLNAILNLAVVVRDEGPEAVDKAATEVFAAAQGDPTAALIIAAALVDVDKPVDNWWRRCEPPTAIPRGPRYLTIETSGESYAGANVIARLVADVDPAPGPRRGKRTA